MYIVLCAPVYMEHLELTERLQYTESKMSGKPIKLNEYEVTVKHWHSAFLCSMQSWFQCRNQCCSKQHTLFMSQTQSVHLPFLGNYLYILKDEKMKDKTTILPIHCSTSSFFGKSKV